MSTWAGWGLTPPGDAWMLVYYVCVNPVIEEWFWRGAIVGRQLREHFGTRTAVFFGVGAFWGFHVFVLWPAFGFTVGLITSFFVLLAGIAWTLLRLRSGHIWWSGLTHLAANLALAILYFARLRGEV